MVRKRPEFKYWVGARVFVIGRKGVVVAVNEDGSYDVKFADQSTVTARSGQMMPHV